MKFFYVFDSFDKILVYIGVDDDWCVVFDGFFDFCYGFEIFCFVMMSFDFDEMKWILFL